jgi:hypothetical protein
MICNHAAVSRRVAAEQQTLQTVAQLVDKYASTLGLTFSAGESLTPSALTSHTSTSGVLTRSVDPTAPGQFVLTFSRLDPEDPERRCSVTLLLDAGGASGTYAVGACDPPVAQADALLAALNASPRGGLPRFVAGMRAAFKSSLGPAALPAA